MKNQILYKKLLQKLKEMHPKYSIEELDLMVKYPFQYVKEMINKDDHAKPILINKFGTFVSTPERRQKINEIVIAKANAKECGEGIQS